MRTGFARGYFPAKDTLTKDGTSEKYFYRRAKKRSQLNINLMYFINKVFYLLVLIFKETGNILYFCLLKGLIRNNSSD